MTPTNRISELSQALLTNTGVTLHDEGADWTLRNLDINSNASVSFEFEFIKPIESSLTSYLIQNDGSTEALNFDPISWTGNRFLQMPDNKLRLIMTAKDGGRGDLSSMADGIITNTSSIGSVDINLDFSTNNNVLTVGDQKSANNAAAAHFLKISCDSKADQVYEVIAIPFAPDEAINLDDNTIQERAYSLLATHEKDDTPSLNGMDLSRTLQVLNNQQLAFFAVKNNRFIELGENPSSSNTFEQLSLSADGSRAVSDSGMSITIEPGSVPDINVIIGSRGKFAPLYDFTSLAGSKLSGIATVAREANFESSLGFYKVENADGAVVNNNGSLINPGEPGYADAALHNDNLLFGGTTFQADDNETKAEVINDFLASGMWAPYAKVHSTGQTYFGFKEANTDGMDHFRIMGNTTIGFEDVFGGGDRDYDDHIFHIDFKLDQ